MSGLKIATGAWVVVCDGKKALICANAGDEKFINLKVVEEHTQKNPPTREQGAERPGRVYQSVGNAHSAVGQTDWHDEAEREFLKAMAERINEAVMAGEVTALVLAAPPRALGMIRPMLSPQTVKAIHAELDKDYVALPVYEIEKRLTE